MKKINSIFISSILISSIFVPSVFAQTGNHLGEAKGLEYRIEYLSPLGVTVVSESGIDFNPYGCCYSHLDKILPDDYFREYPLYFSGSIMSFRVFLHNTTHRTFKNLSVETIQEFLNEDGGEGEPIGNNAQSLWFIEELRPGEEVVLEGVFWIPFLGESGIDQTHLRISHASTNTFEKQFKTGQVIVDDFQAGLWCPVGN